LGSQGEKACGDSRSRSKDVKGAVR
jgi:hypothetical protein